ncbi:ABC transporter permease [Streptomyces sp. SP17KL33]|uniref:ABC transporter permease n=1 Tax=Streptomyces sp. SP17KL33 TaxID=3002534 RepID=UPI002E7A368B|nr:ABC transporter permease [Streptomyces sp. SP17KL33]MEE1831719.1 ABC transporter permease [Streptomyces sp. SP17KL33]
MSLRVIKAAAFVQWRTSVRAPEHLMIILISPFFSVIFLSIVDQAGRGDLMMSTVIGTGLMGIWFVAVYVAGGVILNERYMSTLQLVLAAPRSFTLVVCGRILPVVVIGAFSLVESGLIAHAAFGAPLTVKHPWMAGAAMLTTVYATAATATALSALFILSRNIHSLESIMTYPFYILGGVLFPVAILPEWVRPIARVFFLSWSSDLLRDAVTADNVDNVAQRFGAIIGLGTAALVIGILAVNYTVVRIRRTGAVSLA